MEDDFQPSQISPEDFGKRAAEAMAPGIVDAIKRAMEEWARESGLVNQSGAEPEPWRGGPPSEMQLNQILGKENESTMSQIGRDVNDIKSAVQTMANGTRLS